MEEKDNQNRQYQDSFFVWLFSTFIDKLLQLCKVLDKSITSEDIELIKLDNTLFLKYRAYLLCRLGKNKASTYRYTPTFYFCLVPSIYALYFKNCPKEFHQNINLQSNYLRCILYILMYIRIYKILAECIKNIFDTLLPLRCLQYIGRIFEKIIETRDRYARLLIKIPTPEFYVFYTGNENLPAIQELKLSDAFIQKVEKPQLELIVKVINLNSKENEKLLDECPILKEYTKFVRIVKEYRVKYGKEGYDKAIRHCIKHGILKDFIVQNAKEVESMLVAEYDYDLDMQVQREESYNAGITQGITQGLAQGVLKGILKKATETASRMKKANCDVAFISEMTGLSKEEIEKL